MSRVEPADLSPDVIARALDGETAAFNLFHRRYDPTVRWAVGLRIYRWPELVPQLDDIVQDVWLELTRRDCKRLRYHDAKRGVPFWRFVMVIAMRLGWRIAKRRLGHAEIEEIERVDVLDDDHGIEEKLMDADLVERLAELAKARLDEKDWRLFEGYYVRGERLKDIGSALGMTEDAVFQRHGRLLKKLRALVQELLGEDSTKIPPELVAVLLAAFLATGRGEPSSSDDVDGSAGFEALPLEVEHE